MRAGFTIDIVDPDPDYLGIEIRAWNERFAGTTFIYAGLEQLSEFASQIAGFPACVPDERMYKFGTRSERSAGGYCGLLFHMSDNLGHVALDVDMEDDSWHYSSEAARLSIPVEAADIDRFILSLRAIEAAKRGKATLGQSNREGK